MKGDDYSFLLWIEYLELCRKWWKYWEELFDIFFVVKNKEED